MIETITTTAKVWQTAYKDDLGKMIDLPGFMITIPCLLTGERIKQHPQIHNELRTFYGDKCVHMKGNKHTLCVHLQVATLDECLRAYEILERYDMCN